jgi:hypothetical protein
MSMTKKKLFHIGTQLMARTHLLLYIYSQRPISTSGPRKNLGIETTHSSTPSHLQEALDEALANLLELGLEVLAERTLTLDLGKKVGLVRLEVSEEVGLPLQDLVDGNVVEHTVDTGVDQGNHLVDGHGGVLLLLEELSQTLTTGESLPGSSIQIGTELGEGGDLTVLGQEKLQGTGDLLHGLDLGSGTDTGDGQTDVNGGTDTLVEQLSLQEDLAVGDGNDIGGNVSRNVTTLGLNDGQGSEGTATELVVHLGSTLEKTRVEVENVTGVGLTTGGTTEKQRHLAVGNGLLCQIIVDDQSVLSVVTEELADLICVSYIQVE